MVWRGKTARHVWVRQIYLPTWKPWVGIGVLCTTRQHTRKLELDGLPGRVGPQYPPGSVGSEDGSQQYNTTIQVVHDRTGSRDRFFRGFVGSSLWDWFAGELRVVTGQMRYDHGIHRHSQEIRLGAGWVALKSWAPGRDGARQPPTHTKTGTRDGLCLAGV